METDYISRRAFIEQKERQYCQNCDRRKNSKGQVVYSIGDAPCRACGIRDVLDDVEDFPAADVWPLKVGENITENNSVDEFVCSECGIIIEDWVRVEIDEDDEERTYHEYVFRFCPNCGADMTGGADE
jgi:hypothetical protein